MPGHLCTEMRGVCAEDSRTHTTFWRDSFELDPALRREFMTLVAQAQQ